MLGNVEMQALINKMANTLLVRKAKTLLETIGDVEAETRGDTLGNVEVDSVLKTLAKNLAEAKVKTINDTLGDTSTDTLA